MGFILTLEYFEAVYITVLKIVSHLKVTKLNNFSHRNNTDSVVTSWLPHGSNLSPVFFTAVEGQNVVVIIVAAIPSTCVMKSN